MMLTGRPLLKGKVILLDIFYYPINQQKRPYCLYGRFCLVYNSIPGDDLLFHKAAQVVSLALEGLTSEFEMGSGVAPPLGSPENLYSKIKRSVGYQD